MMSLIVVISQWIYDYESRSVTPRLSNFIEITLRHGCSPRNLLHILRTPFLKNTSERLLLNTIISLLQIKIYLSYYVKQKNIFPPKSDKSKEKYTKQRSSWVTVLWKSKAKYLNNLNRKNICRNKKIWEVFRAIKKKKRK